MSGKEILSPQAPNMDSLIRQLGALQQETRQRAPAPVDLWNPPYCGDLDIRIARDGLWYYLGTPIGRAPLVALFASVLRRDPDDRYYLVTPVERIGIRVDDVPFVVVDVQPSAAGLIFVTNVGDQVLAGPDHPVDFRPQPGGGGAPYIRVRGRLEARVDRKSFYRLVEVGECAPGPDGAEWFGIRSQSVFFPFMPAAEMGIDLA